jgi:hypothetical protein
MRINEKLGGMAPEDNNEGFFALFSSALTRDPFADYNAKSIESAILEKQQELATLIAYQKSRQTKT